MVLACILMPLRVFGVDMKGGRSSTDVEQASVVIKPTQRHAGLNDENFPCTYLVSDPNCSATEAARHPTELQFEV